MSSTVTDTPPSHQHSGHTRRVFLQRMLGTICVTSSASILSAHAMGVATEFATNSQSATTALFSEQQMTTLYAVVDTILPRTDTPSASEVNCHNFIQNQLARCHSAAEQASCVAIINQIDQVSQQQHNKPFAMLSAKQQQTMLSRLEKRQGFSDQDAGQFSFLKALTVFGYFTSEPGATQALAYQAVPGGFKGSIPANAETKSWGSLDYY